MSPSSGGSDSQLGGIARVVTYPPAWGHHSSRADHMTITSQAKSLWLWQRSTLDRSNVS